mgnify:CR=1 FL=1
MYRQDEPEVKLGEFLERIRSIFRRFGGGGGMGAYIVLGVLLIALLVWLGRGIYTVQPGEQTALRLFGKFSDTRGPGLHWWWPTPVGARDTVRTARGQSHLVRKLETSVDAHQTIVQEIVLSLSDYRDQSKKHKNF